MAIAPIGPTLETTYAIQFKNGNGEVWHWYSQAEYVSENDIHELARNIDWHGAGLTYRVVTITRAAGEICSTPKKA